MRILPVLAPATLTDAGTASTGETILFGVVALITVVCGLGLLTAKRAVSAAANMIGIMIGLAVLYVAGEAPFLGMTQIVVYTGAVMTLVLFVIMMVGIGGDEPVSTAGSSAGRWVIALLGVGLVAVLAAVVLVPASRWYHQMETPPADVLTAALVVAAVGCGLIEVIHQVHRRHVARVLAAAGA